MAFNIDSTNKAGFDQGVWVDFMGSNLLIASTSNISYQRLLTRLQQPHRRKIDKGTLDPSIMKELLCKGLSEGILLDWKNVIDGKGEVVEYSTKLAHAALMNNEDLRDFVIDTGANYDNFKIEAVEDAVKS